VWVGRCDEKWRKKSISWTITIKTTRSVSNTCLYIYIISQSIRSHIVNKSAISNVYRSIYCITPPFKHLVQLINFILLIHWWLVEETLT
jgi:hypothetical protein